MKKLVALLYMGFISLIVLPGAAFATPADPSSIDAQLSGFKAIADDVNKFVMWLLWIGAPIAFVIALIMYQKTNDPGDKKDAKRWMTGIVITFILGQLATWLFHSYLNGKF